MIRPLPRALAAGLFAVALCASAQSQPTVSRTGDPWIDARLEDIGSYAGTYREAFVDEMVRYHGVPRDFVAELLARPGWTAGDVYFACTLAMQSGRPCRAVADARQQDPARDWSAIAHDLGITPGYSELRREVAASYGRWARPLPTATKAPAGAPPAGSTAAPPPAAHSAEPQPKHVKPKHG